MRAYLLRPQSVFLRRALFQVHLWTGVTAGLYVFVVCVTGAALVFRIDMQKAAYPRLFTPSAPGPLADPVTIMEHVQAAYPDGRLAGVDAPSTARSTYLAYVTKGSEFLTVLVDPVNARVLGLLPDRTWVRTLQDLHFDLLAGRTGRVVNGVGALLLLAMCVTGLVIWWPGIGQWRRALTVDVARSWKRVIWDLHSAVGIWTLALTAMWAITGLNFVFPGQIRAMINRLSPISVVRAPQSDSSTSGASPPTWQSIVETARARVPGQFVARVVLPSNDRGAFLVMLSPVSPTPAGSTELTSVYIDQHSGAVLSEPPRGARTAGDIVMAWLSPFHVGSFGGAIVRVAWLILGMAPPLLFVTGCVMWWVRVVRPQRPRGASRVAL
jgi:uncharacterized iron-regulated membrane protein